MGRLRRSYIHPDGNQPNDTLRRRKKTIIICRVSHCYAECRYGECRYGECRDGECCGAKTLTELVMATPEYFQKFEAKSYSRCGAVRCTFGCVSPFQLEDKMSWMRERERERERESEREKERKIAL